MKDRNTVVKITTTTTISKKIHKIERYKMWDQKQNKRVGVKM